MGIFFWTDKKGKIHSNNYSEDALGGNKINASSKSSIIQKLNLKNEDKARSGSIPQIMWKSREKSKLLQDSIAKGETVPTQGAPIDLMASKVADDVRKQMRGAMPKDWAKEAGRTGVDSETGQQYASGSGGTPISEPKSEKEKEIDKIVADKVAQQVAEQLEKMKKSGEWFTKEEVAEIGSNLEATLKAKAKEKLKDENKSEAFKAEEKKIEQERENMIKQGTNNPFAVPQDGAVPKEETKKTTQSSRGQKPAEAKSTAKAESKSVLSSKLSNAIYDVNKQHEIWTKKTTQNIVSDETGKEEQYVTFALPVNKIPMNVLNKIKKLSENTATGVSTILNPNNNSELLIPIPSLSELKANVPKYELSGEKMRPAGKDAKGQLKPQSRYQANKSPEGNYWFTLRARLRVVANEAGIPDVDFDISGLKTSQIGYLENIFHYIKNPKAKV